MEYRISKGAQLLSFLVYHFPENYNSLTSAYACVLDAGEEAQNRFYQQLLNITLNTPPRDRFLLLRYLLLLLIILYDLFAVPFVVVVAAIASYITSATTVSTTTTAGTARTAITTTTALTTTTRTARTA